MKILLDMDSIIVDLPATWYTIHNERHGCTLSNETVKSWDIHKWCTCDSGEAVYGHLLEQGFFAGCQPMPYAILTIENLAKEHEIHFVTSAPLGSPWPVHEKWGWLKQHLPDIANEHNFWITKSKGMIDADIMFDDYPANFKGFKGLCIVMDYPYNRHWSGMRVKNWLRFKALVDELQHGRFITKQLSKPKYTEAKGQIYNVTPAINTTPGGPKA